MKRAEDQILIIFGASGDLTGRKLVPALYELHTRQLLPERFAILGAARTAYNDEEYRDQQARNIRNTRTLTPEEEAALPSFLQRVHYLTIESTDPDEYERLKDRIHELRHKENLPDRLLYYMATPPFMYRVIPSCLEHCRLNKTEEPDGWRRIVVEKPFGHSLESAQQLNSHLRGIFDEKEIYRIDHYLGKETVQNILVLRFSNGIFEPLWNRNYIDSVEISATETLGVGTRGKYYDGAGALRDMVQNHLMQLLGFIAMESPSAFESETIRDEITKVFRSLHPYLPNEIDEWVVRGQYEGYRNEPDVAPNSTTETYVAMKLFIDNWRWSGVPFYIRTGKNLPAKTSEIVVNFKSTPHSLFVGQCSGSSCNKLVIRIQPDESISLHFGLKKPGAGFTVKQVEMDFKYNSLGEERLPDAYERLLMDVMQGDSTLYARNDALLASWTVIDPILQHWNACGEKGLYLYKAGQDGPSENSETSRKADASCETELS
ncbi:MAG: glucose-6-phosphate dehydrogenase [Paraprevotella sp.]|nr:glucose-6-phosphate dehydrogenase [Paraprevotella sp.]